MVFVQQLVPKLWIKNKARKLDIMFFSSNKSPEKSMFPTKFTHVGWKETLVPPKMPFLLYTKKASTIQKL